MDPINARMDKIISSDEESELKDLTGLSLDVLQTPGVTLRAQEIANNILEKYLAHMYKKFI